MNYGDLTFEFLLILPFVIQCILNGVINFYLRGCPEYHRQNVHTFGFTLVRELTTWVVEGTFNTHLHLNLGSSGLRFLPHGEGVESTERVESGVHLPFRFVLSVKWSLPLV